LVIIKVRAGNNWTWRDYRGRFYCYRY